MHQFTFKAITVAIPKLIDAAADRLSKLFFNEDPPLPHQPRRRSGPRKKRDTAPITRQQHDFVCKMEEVWRFQNANRKPDEPFKTKDELTDYLNEKLHLNKSRTFYARIWNGQTDREKLLEGMPIKRDKEKEK